MTKDKWISQPVPRIFVEDQVSFFRGRTSPWQRFDVWVLEDFFALPNNLNGRVQPVCEQILDAEGEELPSYPGTGIEARAELGVLE